MPTRFELPGRPPYSFDAVVQSHGWVQLSPFSWNQDDRTMQYVDRLASGRVVSLLVRDAPGGAQVSVQDALDPTESAEVVEKVTWMLALAQDLSAFYTRVRSEPRLQQVETQARGRLLRSSTLFEDVVKTILTTNTTWSGTKRMVAALVQLYGEPLPDNPERRAFPTPAALAAADVDALKTAARLGYRAPYILELAQNVAAGALDLEPLKATDMPTAQLRQELLKIKGIGGYAAASLLMLLGRYDYLPVDSWAFKLVSSEWHDGAPIGLAEVEAAFAGWGEWKGLAYWFWEWSSQF